MFGGEERQGVVAVDVDHGRLAAHHSQTGIMAARIIEHDIAIRVLRDEQLIQVLYRYVHYCPRGPVAPCLKVKHRPKQVLFRIKRAFSKFQLKFVQSFIQTFCNKK